MVSAPGQADRAARHATAVYSSSSVDGEDFWDCRFGATVFPSYWSGIDVAPFHLGTYLDFGTANYPPGPTALEYWQMVRVRQNKSGGQYLDGYTINPDWGTLGQRVEANPGALWIVGNEPDREYIQDDTYPEVYAQAYHDVYFFIKNTDSTSRVAVAGLVGFTPGREQYMDIVWDTYVQEYGSPMPVDVWTIHPYVLWESGGAGAHVALGTDPAIAIPYSSNCADPASICHAEHDDLNLFGQQIVRMRQWMLRHGQQDKPLLVTEWGMLLPYRWEDGSLFYDENGETFNPVRVSRFLTGTLEYFRHTTDSEIGYPMDGYHLVQQWSWYALGVSGVEAAAGNLVEPETPYTTTYVGQVWQEYVDAITPTVNLSVKARWTVILHPTSSATLTAEIYNNGNVSTGSAVTVTFYSDSGLITPIMTRTLPALSGCVWGGRTVTATWDNVGDVGVHPFWVAVVGPEESFLEDNVAQGAVLVASSQVFLPIITRD